MKVLNRITVVQHNGHLDLFVSKTNNVPLWISKHPKITLKTIRTIYIKPIN